MKIERHTLLGVPIDALTLDGLLSRVDTIIRRSGRQRIMYANIHCLNTAYDNTRLQRIYNQAETVYCDGAGVVMGAKINGKHLPGRMTGADFIYHLCAMCAHNGHTLFFLGGKPGVGETAAARLVKKYPKLKVAGIYHGYFSPADNESLINRINELKPDILLVGMGTPNQEYWIDKNFNKLEVPVVWAIGAVMDFVSQMVPRAPKWMLENGMEWLFRLLIEPRRMYKRYLLGNFLFLYRIVKTRHGVNSQ